MQAANAADATDVPDNAPQNIYATVKVNGKIVATLYNAGSSLMTNDAAAKVGDLQDPPGLIGGPDLAQWRAERIAKAVGGTVEKATTAITQSAWKPRQTTSTDYTRAQLDAAFEAMMARTTEGYRAAVCGLSNSARILRRLCRLQRLTASQSAVSYACYPASRSSKSCTTPFSRSSLYPVIGNGFAPMSRVPRQRQSLLCWPACPATPLPQPRAAAAPGRCRRRRGG